MSRDSRTTQLVTIALLLTIEIILSRICSLYMPTGFRIGLGFLPIAVVAILYGPIWAALTYAMGDIIGWFLFPAGPYFPGFTVTAFLTGLIFGIILYKKPVTWQRTLIASSIIVVALNFVLDTYWLYLLYDESVAGLIPMRAVKCAVSLVLQVTMIPLIWNRCLLRVPFIKSVPSK